MTEQTERDRKIPDADKRTGDLLSDNDNDTAARNSAASVDNGFFVPDTTIQVPEENEKDKGNFRTETNEKTTPLGADQSKTLADRVSVNGNSDDTLARVVDDQKPAYTNEDDQAH